MRQRGNQANREARTSILRYLAFGQLVAHPRSHMLEHSDLAGTKTFVSLEPNSEMDQYVLPIEFWQIFVDPNARVIADWALGDFDIQLFRDATGSYSGYVRRVLFNRQQLPGFRELPSSVASTASIDMHKALRRGGRPPKWDWEGAMAHLVALANGRDGLHPEKDGEELTSSYIGDLLANWFVAKTGEHPSDSELRKRGSQILVAMEALLSEKR
jgi:hypothetical protein